MKTAARPWKFATCSVAPGFPNGYKMPDANLSIATDGDGGGLLSGTAQAATLFQQVLPT